MVKHNSEADLFVPLAKAVLASDYPVSAEGVAAKVGWEVDVASEYLSTLADRNVINHEKAPEFDEMVYSANAVTKRFIDAYSGSESAVQPKAPAAPVQAAPAAPAQAAPAASEGTGRGSAHTSAKTGDKVLNFLKQSGAPNDIIDDYKKTLVWKRNVSKMIASVKEDMGKIGS